MTVPDPTPSLDLDADSVWLAAFTAYIPLHVDPDAERKTAEMVAELEHIHTQMDNRAAGADSGQT